MTERVRESLFSALDARDRIRGAGVLDLYAGSGSLAIEALSRGADHAVLVEQDRVAASVARGNLELAGFAAVAVVLERAVEAVSAGPPPPGAPFDLVFCDPPYALDDAQVGRVLERVTGAGWLHEDALLVVHRRATPPPPPVGWRVAWQRAFGDTLLVLIVPEGPGPG